ncbi:hypothetical protein DA01_03025 [Dehalococcoides mccartyi]|uniref:Uncharacterized protein n=1 Tax=Dehalococcoides mccartyi TaxID=61435 RepID=A0A0V8M417_9CHLR|nr:hypothetical protein DA01_03025 [Dehalococcoides mccartyi]
MSAGGDQGRDFETFRTYLNMSPISASSFIGLVSGEPIAFACTTTDLDNLTQKIKSDVVTIKNSGEAVSDIHYFCTADLPVGRRHEIQQWANDTHNVHLEVYDGQAISELLSDRDTFWIAENYLHIPAELYPPDLTTDASWYHESLELWKNPDHAPDNYADFIQIKSALRHSTVTDAARTDLPFWIKLMISIGVNTPLLSLKRKTIYEVTVASLRGYGSLLGHEKEIQTYFNDIPSLSELSEIEDTSVLITFCIGADRQNVVQFEEGELSSWIKQVVDKIESELKVTKNPDRRCTLLRLRADRYLIPGPRSANVPDITMAMECWLELASLVDQTHLFPLDNFSDELTQLTSLPLDINKHKDYRRLTRQVDEALEKRFGSFTAADKCRDRAITLFEKGQYLDALNEIHDAKIKWFASETLEGSVLATRLASRCYQELGLTFAAKYYSMIGAHVSINCPDEPVSKHASPALVDAAFSDYMQGAFCGFFEFSDFASLVYRALSSEQNTKDIITEIERTVYHATIIRVIALRFAPELLTFVDERISRWEGIKELFSAVVPLAEKEWSDNNVPDLWRKLEENLIDRPFSDVGPNRVVHFRALGITWEFSWENDYELTASSEEFIAVLQIILADFYNIDLCLPRTMVQVEMRSSAGDKIQLENLPSNDLIRYRISIPTTIPKDPLDAQVFGIASAILGYVSFLPQAKFMLHLESALRQGLSGKTFFVQSYRNLFSRFIVASDFNRTGRKIKSIPQIGLPFEPISHNQSEWLSSLGPGYSKENAIQTLKNRYEVAPKPIRFTLLSLLTNAEFRKTVAELKTAGWLDWHILTAVALATVNYRVNKQRHPSQGMTEYQRLFMDTLNQEEDVSWDPVPLSLFNKEKLKFHLFSSMGSTLKGLGFEIHQPTPDFNAISDFLGRRYNYWSDDIEHPDFGF